MLNKIMLIGRLGSEPEMKYLQDGTSLGTFNLAVNKKKKDGSQDTIWFRCSAFRQVAENACKYLHKGNLVFVEGEVIQRKWQDKNTGQERQSWEVQVGYMDYMEPKSQQTQPQQQPTYSSQGQYQAPPLKQQQIPGWNVPPTGDEVPF